jgi:hypothetical protein
MISVFNQRKKQIAIGERILFGRNNKKLNVKNGQTGVVAAINGDIITIKKQEKSIAIDMNEYPYLDYAYCISDVKAQGKTSKNVIVATHSQQSSRASFYVQLTRAKANLQFFVNDAVKFRIGIEDEKTKNSTLRKTLQGIQNDRRVSHARTVAADKSNHAINQRNRTGYSANAATNTKQHHIAGESSINDGSDLHNAQGPLKRVGWKLELCRFGGLFEKTDGSDELNRGFTNNAEQHDGESNDLIFKVSENSISSEIVHRTKLPL